MPMIGWQPLEPQLPEILFAEPILPNSHQISQEWCITLRTQTIFASNCQLKDKQIMEDLEDEIGFILLKIKIYRVVVEVNLGKGEEGEEGREKSKMFRFRPI